MPAYRVEEVCNLLDDETVERVLGAAATDTGLVGEVTVGEFEGALRAQIADARDRLERAHETEDPDDVAFLGLRVRYLLEVAAEGGIDVDQARAIEPGGAGEDAEE